ncbi:MAG TPA: tRNA (guanosine(46)-N7)-methyltransferase TrmB [Gammaproteobacteria bacterium]
MSGEVHLRRVRSFVRRPGRITAAQRRALATLAPRYCLPRGERLDLDAVFGRRAPRVLDVGFGDGEALLTAAVNFPQLDYLGIEVHEPGIGHLLLLLEQAGVSNVRVIEGDATEVMPETLADASIAAVNLFFPDPWPKKRHHKRRLVQPPFVAEMARVLEDGGLLHVATDWASYADHTRAVLAESDQFVTETAADLCHNPLAFRAPTKFERRGRRLGHEIVDLYYRRVPRRPADTP